MGGVDRGFHLFEGECLAAGHIPAGARGAVYLHPIGSSGDLLANYAQNVRHAVGGSWRRRAAAADSQSVPGDEHARARHQAAVDQVAHGDIGVVGGAEIAHRGNARLKRLAGVFLREIHHGGRTPGRAHGVVQEVCEVRMSVDQAGNRGVAREIDCRGRALANAPNAVAFRGNTGVLPAIAAIPDRAEAVRTGVRGREIQQEQSDASGRYISYGRVSTHGCLNHTGGACRVDIEEFHIKSEKPA